MGRRLRGVAGVVGIAVFAAVLLRGAFAVLDHAAARDRGDVVIGSKAFTESIILGEIMAQWLERRAGLRVVRRFNLGGTHICFQALRTGAIDTYPEYTGTGLMAILHRPATSDPRAALDAVRGQFAARYGLVWLEPLGFDNTYALAVPTHVAARLGLRRISDLARHPELTLGFASEFLARDDGWPGLRARYGLHFSQGEPRGMEAGLMYRAASAGEIDVVSAYSTDGRIATMGLTLLDDDRRFFPPYEAVPVVRQALLARHPRVGPLLRALGGRITPAAMRRMNAAVDSEHRSPEAVAREFLATLRVE
jgi:glycine betaine/choline ABC-type transport system substrate-binding protein